MKKIHKTDKVLAAEKVADYCRAVWKKAEADIAEIPLEGEGPGSDCLISVLEEFLGRLPNMDDAARDYWIATKYEICQIAYHEYLKPDLYLQSVAGGILIKRHIKNREMWRLLERFRRLLNHAIELDVDITFLENLPPEDAKIMKKIRALEFLVFEQVIGDEIKRLPLDDDSSQLLGQLERRYDRHKK